MTEGPSVRVLFVVICQLPDDPSQVGCFPFQWPHEATAYLDYQVSKGCTVGQVFKATLDPEPMHSVGVSSDVVRGGNSEAPEWFADLDGEDYDA